MPDQITSQGTNSQGNSYDTRADSSGTTGYHYSNTDGSYYYSNTNGSTYYNSGDGYAQYTSSSGDSKSYYGSDAKK
ncbi:hypothetical protein EHS25_000690 [Saitozyma podzolica]|uniref:Uncharacterized protein n=1 Tax=Saitozyma podzolica TaxID=1890683 RepID=A0A427YWT3_9TREE|nr:hypothetical protein EHS25_000690 [Saitozyma podzolica]